MSEEFEMSEERHEYYRSLYWKLKSGEYEGEDIMRAYCAIDQLSK